MVQLRELRALIGYFDLDPIRLADIVLDAFAADPKNLAFLELMQLFPQGSLPHILGFKFKLAAEVPSWTPAGLKQGIADLPCHGMLKTYGIHNTFYSWSDVRSSQLLRFVHLRFMSCLLSECCRHIPCIRSLMMSCDHISDHGCACLS